LGPLAQVLGHQSAKAMSFDLQQRRAVFSPLNRQRSMLIPSGSTSDRSPPVAHAHRQRSLQGRSPTTTSEHQPSQASGASARRLNSIGAIWSMRSTRSIGRSRSDRQQISSVATDPLQRPDRSPPASQAPGASDRRQIPSSAPSPVHRTFLLLWWRHTSPPPTNKCIDRHPNVSQ
jgi:hypothetical protein